MGPHKCTMAFIKKRFFNRPIKGIKGFTKEIIIAITTNVESQEKRRKENHLLAKHPRASTADDVEGFIANLHQMFGQTFDMKIFREN